MKATDRRRRRSTMGVIGDKVLIPGSPVTTLPDLLQRAEDDIRRSRTRSASISVMEQDSPRTPVSVRLVNQDDLFRSVSTIPEAYPAGTREWTKADWKLLDACFTDQRISPGGFHCMLAPVDTVSLEDVVARFVDIMGGESLIVTFGEAWSKYVSRRLSIPSHEVNHVYAGIIFWRGLGLYRRNSVPEVSHHQQHRCHPPSLLPSTFRRVSIQLTSCAQP